MTRVMQHQVRLLKEKLCQSTNNKLFVDKNWLDDKCGQVAIMAGGEDLVDSHYKQITLLDDISALNVIAKPQI